MTTQHTPGRLIAGVSIFQDREVFTAVPRDSGQKIVALFGFCRADDEEESIANLRRFVACWNACEGIETHALELMTGDLAIKEQITATGKAKPRLTHRAVEYRWQRDELLEALKVLHARYVQCIGNEGPEALAARAAIAKAEGGAA